MASDAALSTQETLVIANSRIGAGGHKHHIRKAKLGRSAKDVLNALLAGMKKGKSKAGEPSPSEDTFTCKSNEQMISNGLHLSEVNMSLVEKYGKCREIVGRGMSGVVRVAHKGMKGKKDHLFAVKEFRQRSDEKVMKEDFIRMVVGKNTLSFPLRHPNIVHTLDLMQNAKGNLCAVMEFCAGGDLHKFILENGNLVADEADCFFKQLMCGIEYLHEQGIVHRDLKPENLVLTMRGALKIADFGNSQYLRIADLEVQMVTGVCGSGPYIAPEQYTEEQFDGKAADVWATGVIYMAMRTGRYLWMVARVDEAFYQEYITDRRTEEGYAPIEGLHKVFDLPVDFGEVTAKVQPKVECSNVIYSLLDPHRSRRITASQYLKTEWAREIQVCKAGRQGL